VTVSNLTINASNLPIANNGAMRWSNSVNGSFTGNAVVGGPNSSLPAVWFEGGSDNQLTHNMVTTSVGGAVLQIQALDNTPNSGFVVSNNTFDSSNFLEIGLNNTQIINNSFNDKTLGDTIAILASGPFTGTSQNITISGNTVDATAGGNGAIISGIPQDP